MKYSLSLHFKQNMKNVGMCSCPSTPWGDSCPGGNFPRWKLSGWQFS